MRMTKKHTVNASFQTFDLTKAGTSLELEVFSHQSRDKREKIGTLIVGHGSVRWKKANGKKALVKNWTQFSAMMEQ